MPFDHRTGSPFDDEFATITPLMAAATAVTTAAADAATHRASGSLVVVLHPGTDRVRVVASHDNALRAAVSVTVAAGNTRLWADGRATAGDTIERPVYTLPEIVRAAAEGEGVSVVHVGVVDGPVDLHGEPAAMPVCVAIWFDSVSAATVGETRREAIRVLTSAAHRDAQHRLLVGDADRSPADATGGSAAGTSGPAVDQGFELRAGVEHPDVDALTGLASAARFERSLDEYASDEASLLLIDLDDFASVNATHGEPTGDLLLQEVARRLAATLRRADLVARLHSDRFAVLLGDADRATALQISRRLLAAIAEPLPPEMGTDPVTATVALAHQFGLLDMDELRESADEAVASGKRSGRGRVVVAS